MNPRRLAKISQAIKEVVGMTILTGLRDPRIKNVTVIAAEAAPDLRTAKVYISVLGEPKVEALCLKGLESARGYIQSKVADRLQTKQTPVLQFVVDRGVKKSIEVSRALHELETTGELYRLHSGDPEMEGDPEEKDLLADSEELSADGEDDLDDRSYEEE